MIYVEKCCFSFSLFFWLGQTVEISLCIVLYGVSPDLSECFIFKHALHASYNSHINQRCYVNKSYVIFFQMNGMVTVFEQKNTKHFAVIIKVFEGVLYQLCYIYEFMLIHCGNYHFFVCPKWSKCLSKMIKQNGWLQWSASCLKQYS